MKSWGLEPIGPPASLCSLAKGCGGEIRPSGSQGDGVGYSDFGGLAATSSRHRASSVVLFRGSCAALDEAPPVEPPERTSGNTGKALGREGLGAIPGPGLDPPRWSSKQSAVQGRVRGLQPEAQDDGGEPRTWPNTTHDSSPRDPYCLMPHGLVRASRGGTNCWARSVRV